MTNEMRLVCAAVLAIVVCGKFLFGPERCIACNGTGYHGHGPCPQCQGRGSL
jgi:DnaJ-class molecular chaperone